MEHMRHNQLIDSMITLFEGDARRINHFLKVYAFAKTIAEQEQLGPDLQEIVEVVAITHDIGIRTSETKYGTSNATLQQTEGPPVARKLLTSLGYDSNLIERVCHIISLHHTYSAIEGEDFQILVEADLLVNLDEKHSEETQVRSMQEKIFKTPTGLRYLQALFLHCKPAQPL